MNKFLLAGDKCIPGMHLRFTYSTCEPFTENKERIQKFTETKDSRYIYQNQLDKVYFQLDMTYVGFKDLTRRTASDEILGDETFSIAKISKYHGYQRGLASMVYIFFDKKSIWWSNKKIRLCLIKN